MLKIMVPFHIFIPSILKIPHNGFRARECEYGDESERQLQTHQHIQHVVHHRQVLYSRERGHQDGGKDSDASGEQNTHPALPFEIQETLNKEEKKGKIKY